MRSELLTPTPSPTAGMEVDAKTSPLRLPLPVAPRRWWGVSTLVVALAAAFGLSLPAAPQIEQAVPFVLDTRFVAAASVPKGASKRHLAPAVRTIEAGQARQGRSRAQ